MNYLLSARQRVDLPVAASVMRACRRDKEFQGKHSQSPFFSLTKTPRVKKSHINMPPSNDPTKGHFLPPLLCSLWSQCIITGKHFWLNFRWAFWQNIILETIFIKHSCVVWEIKPRIHNSYGVCITKCAWEAEFQWGSLNNIFCQTRAFIIYIIH